MITTKETHENAKDVVSTLLNALVDGKVKEIYVVSFDCAGNAIINYSGDWLKLGIATSLLQAEFQLNYEG